jgi:hypothetical protein
MSSIQWKSNYSTTTPCSVCGESVFDLYSHYKEKHLSIEFLKLMMDNATTHVKEQNQKHRKYIRKKMIVPIMGNE